MNLPKKIRIGEMLVNTGVITQEQLERALDEQKRTGRRIGRTLIDSGIVDEMRLVTLLAQQLGIDYVDLRNIRVDRETVKRLTEQQARRYRALILGRRPDGMLKLGMADPTDLHSYDELARIVGGEFELCALSESQLMMSIDRFYEASEGLADLAKELKADLSPDATVLAQLEGAGPDDTTAVARLLASVFEDAVRARASDVHFEPQADHLQVRFRVDGVMRSHAKFDAEISSAVALRLKLISNLDISEKRLPQDGRFEITVRDATVDMRISIMPSHWGESVVLRLLQAATDLPGIDAIGMRPEVEAQVRRAIAKSRGMILVTGPTGSGKTTTLYALLNALRGEERKLITVEDPIEYRLPGITQVQVHERIDLTFPRVLRSVLRHDPDVVMVGEMRDAVTAEIGVRAAMTGHLVLSTLHTNDAASTPARLTDMGIPPYLIATSLQLLIAQRLVRRICPDCSEPATPSPQEHAWLIEIVGQQAADSLPARHGKGCTRCNHTGLVGRAAIYESLEIDRSLADALSHNDTDEYWRIARQRVEGKRLAHDAVRLVSEGVTTLEEAMKVATDDAEDA